MFNVYADIYKHTRQSGEDKYESTPSFEDVEVFLEPASQTLVAPIDTTIGIVHNVYIDSFIALGIKTGDKIVNVDDSSDYYIINSAVQIFKKGDNYHYEFVADKPLD